MSSIELRPSQKTILTALVNLHSEQDAPVKGEAIAEQVDRNPGTIRNQMQSLKALQLVEGVPGPKGGYKPTANAYDALDIQEMEDPAVVPVRHNGELLDEINVDSIELTSVYHPELCRAEIQLRGSVRTIEEGDAVVVGPTPLSKLVIEGSVDGTDEAKNIVILRIDRMQAPTEDPQH